MSNTSIWPIDLSGATTLGHSGPGSNVNKGVLHIPQSSEIGTSPSDDFVSYPLGESYSSVEILSVYSTASALFKHIKLELWN